MGIDLSGSKINLSPAQAHITASTIQRKIVPAEQKKTREKKTERQIIRRQFSGAQLCKMRVVIMIEK